MPTADLLQEMFEPVGGVSIRRMFGGLGIFKQGIMFGLVADDVLYLKTDEATAPRFQSEGSKPWIYRGRHRAQTVTAYWRVPERLFDEHDEFREWANEAFAAALRKVAAKEKSGAKRSKKPAAKAKAKVKLKVEPKAKAKPKPKKKAAPKRR